MPTSSKESAINFGRLLFCGANCTRNKPLVNSSFWRTGRAPYLSLCSLKMFPKLFRNLIFPNKIAVINLLQRCLWFNGTMSCITRLCNLRGRGRWFANRHVLVKMFSSTTGSLPQFKQVHHPTETKSSIQVINETLTFCYGLLQTV